MATKRIGYIDLVKGFCIILVVLAHIFQHLLVKTMYLALLSTFIMPLFFFLSGLFFKEYEGFSGFLVRKINKLLIPFCFFYIITSFIYPNILHFMGITVPHKASLGIQGLWAFITKEKNFTNGPLWFLLCLFIVNMLFYLCVTIVKKICISGAWQAAFLAIICFAAGVSNSMFIASHINLWGYVDSAIAALPFYCVGYLFNKYTDILQPNALDKYLPIFIIICLALKYLFGGSCNYMQNIYRINPFAQYLCGITGTLFVVFLAKMINDIPLISYWGRYSLMILVSHQLILQVLSSLLRKAHLPIPVTAVLLLGIVMFSYQLIIPLMKRYLPHVTAQKDVIKIKENNIQ